jgi:dTDP-glucose 4,6-dehydratase
VTRVLDRLGLDPAEWVEHVADCPNHDRRYLIEPGKIERGLGWRPEVEFAERLAGTVDWYVENRDWSDRVFAARAELQIDRVTATLPEAAR